MAAGVKDAFRRWDADGTGTVTRATLRKTMAELGLDASLVDRYGAGEEQDVRYSEFIDWVFSPPAEARVHVVRHGQVDNPNAVFYGRLPGFGLHANGREQAASCGKLLGGRGVALVCASPMQRAQDTAAIIARALDLGDSPSRTLEGVNEVRSCHEGRPIADLAATDWRIYDALPVADGAEPPPSGESFDELGKRTIGAVKELAAELHADHRGRRGEPPVREAVIVTHGDCCAAARLWARGASFTLEERQKLQDEGYPSYCSISTLFVDKDGCCVGQEYREVLAESPDGKVS